MLASKNIFVNLIISLNITFLKFKVFFFICNFCYSKTEKILTKKVNTVYFLEGLSYN